MWDLFGNHIVGFPTRRLNYIYVSMMARHLLDRPTLKYTCIWKSHSNERVKTTFCDKVITVYANKHIKKGKVV